MSRRFNQFESLEIRQVLNAGGLDLTFGNGGKFIPDPNTPPGFIVPTDLAVQADGKLLYLGIGFNDVAPVVRLNANGTVDTSFGESRNGLARSGYGLYQSDGVGLAVGPQGKIAVVGFAAPFHFEDTPQSTLVVYDSNGLLDNSFNGTGTLVARQYPRGFQDVAFQSDGKIVVVGTEKLLRYNANGTPDASFGGGDGIVDYGGKNVLVDANGRIVVLGFNAVYRFNTNGTLDSSFSGDGVIPSVHGSDIAFAPDDDVLLLGNGAHNEYLTRFNAADGSLDTAFGNATPGNTYVPDGQSLAVNGNDIFVGNTFTSTAATLDDLEIRAYTLGGKVDTTFGNGGRVQTDVNNASKDELIALAVQQGKLVALAETDAPLPPPGGSERVSAVLRYETDLAPPASQTPFSGTPVALPGTINAADFDKGGEGVAYHDTDAANVGGAYRTGEGVDIQNKTGVGPYLGFVKVGEWVEYTVDIPTTGSYDIFIGTAHLGNGGTFHLELDGARITDQLTVRHGRDWQDFASVVQNSITLPAGRHVLRLSFDTNGSFGYVGNFLNLVFRNHVGPARSPFLGQPYRDGERVESENYDTGGEGVTYHDTDAANLGGPYRQGEGVDLQPTTDAGDGFNVGFLKPGEWQEYTVDFTQAGPFNLNVRLASLRSGGSFRVLVDGATVVTFNVTDTGGWQTYRTLSKGGVNVSQGLHVVRFQMDKANSTGYVVNLNWFEFKKT